MNIISGEELFSKDFPPLQHIVENMIVANTVWMLAGRPKSGKSWLLMHLARALDDEGLWLGRKTKRPSRVLYIALEDGERRVWERLHAMDWKPKHVDFIFELGEPLGQGGETMFSVLKASHGYEVFILDTLRAAIGAQDENDNNFMSMLINTVATLAHQDGFTLILSHHTRKGAGNEGDSFDAIRGASAMRGSYDGGAVLKRARGERVAHLELESRDMDVEDVVIEWFGPKAGWQLVGTRAEYQQDRIQRVRAAIISEARERSITVDDAADIIARELHIARTTAVAEARRILSALMREGALKRAESTGGKRGRPSAQFRAE